MTVYEKLKTILPNEDFIYFGDLKNCPYGQKSKEQLVDLTSEIFNYFQMQEVKAVVMACNTTSANVYDEYKNLNITDDNINRISPKGKIFLKIGINRAFIP